MSSEQRKLEHSSAKSNEFREYGLRLTHFRLKACCNYFAA